MKSKTLRTQDAVPLTEIRDHEMRRQSCPLEESVRHVDRALYCVRCFSNPASGPRHEASPRPASRNPPQAPGS